jgi:hypothetical protein
MTFLPAGQFIGQLILKRLFPRWDLVLLFNINYNLGVIQMQLFIQKKTRLAFLALAVVGALSACGGGGGQPDRIAPPPPDDKPSGNATKFGRVGIDVALFSTTPTNATGGLLEATVDSSANITLTDLGHQVPSEPLFSYNFAFPSGLPGGSVTGNLFTFTNGAANKVVSILTPSATKFVQNILWRDKNDPAVFGLGAAGYVYQISSNWPTVGLATYTGKAFQYIVDSNAADSSATTYALYSSDATAVVDYLANTITIGIAPNPQLINAVGDPAIVNTDPSQFNANYKFPASNSNFFTGSYYHFPLSDMPSGLGLPIIENALAFYGSNAEEVGGFARYSGGVTTTAGPMTRDQFISFALVKQ